MANRVRGAIYVIMTNLIKICQTIVEILLFINFCHHMLTAYDGHAIVQQAAQFTNGVTSDHSIYEYISNEGVALRLCSLFILVFNVTTL